MMKQVTGVGGRLSRKGIRPAVNGGRTARKAFPYAVSLNKSPLAWRAFQLGY